MTNNCVGVAELFHLLESNKLGDVEETKKVFHDHFLSTKDSWLVNGLFDYYLSTNSLRAIEVVAGVREPHDKHLLDRLSETISKSACPGQRVQALTVLGHVARRQPTWLYKLTNHSLFKELLKLLKVDTDPLSMMSALLLLVTLLPMLPAALGPYLTEIFEIFSRLASFHHVQSSNLAIPGTNSNNNIEKDQFYLLHLQLGLYSLFHRLYAMYPCNLIAYLRHQYSQRDHDTTFRHTIKPILDSVRMHPLLITASKDAEINAARWKKMEHHDVVAECGRFALDRSREESFASTNPRATPLLDQQCPYTPVSVAEGLFESETTNGMEEDTFWSPSMTILPQSPTPIQATSHEPRSAPSTPNNNNRTNSSPPEAAIEATPETTPVKDIRQLSTRAPPIGSAAVRALSAFGNGALTNNSRPSTPVYANTYCSAFVAPGLGSGDGGGGGILSQKISRLYAERHTALQSQKLSNVEGVGRILENSSSQNGKDDSWNEDLEVLEIVNSRSRKLIYTDCDQTYTDGKIRMNIPKKTKRKKLNLAQMRRSLSCPNIESPSFDQIMIESSNVIKVKTHQEVSTQTKNLVPYEHLLTGILEQRCLEQQKSQESSDSILSPSSMLDRYIEACARINTSGNDQLKMNKKKSVNDDGTDDTTDESFDSVSINQQLQLMQMQLLFERQRREVHAERNRRLLGKLRDSRALEEQNTALTDRLRMARNEIDGLKSEMDHIKKDRLQAENRTVEAMQHWQSKCVEEQQQNRGLNERIQILELKLKEEQKKVTECEQQTRKAEAALFEAAHKLKDALRAASRGDEYKKTLENVRKQFLLLGEAHIKLQERTLGPVSMSRQEAAQIQKAYNEELLSLRRQLENRTSLAEARRVRLGELEAREEKKEKQLIEQQRLLQETKERNEAELRAVESKYKAQVEINLLLESRILELHGHLEAATCRSSTSALNVASSASPKERSPPLSGSLASSSEGSLAFHAGTSIMSDCCDSAGEIANLHAIVEPAPSISNQATTTTTPLRSTSQKRK